MNDETEFIARTLAGDLRAFETLLLRHRRALYRTARAILRDDAEAQDAVQDACLHAYRGLASFRGESKFSTWLVRIVANEALMRRRRNLKAPFGESQIDDFASAHTGPEALAHQAEVLQELQGRIDRLPPEYREVFRLRALEDLSVAETAAALGIPEATVRSRFFRARTALRAAMAAEREARLSLDTTIHITDKDLARLRLLKPHAALLREMDRATVISAKAAALADVVTMNTQVVYTDERSGTQRQVNIVYPHEAAGCACCVSILAPVGTALIGLSAGQTIEWEFSDGERRLRVERIIHDDCPLNNRRTLRS
jgi:RNA polymerase sigma-70 factor (ECF subfamily)